MALRGKYKIKYHEKYLGNPRNVVYRSKWEREAFKFIENHPNVKKWASEEIKIPYVLNGKVHRYYPDLYIEMKSGVKMLIEIKPASQCKPPTSAKHKRFITEMARWKKNQAKWDAAEDFCKRAGIKWYVWTEKTLNKTFGLKI